MRAYVQTYIGVGQRWRHVLIFVYLTLVAIIVALSSMLEMLGVLYEHLGIIVILIVILSPLVGGWLALATYHTSLSSRRWIDPTGPVHHVTIQVDGYCNDHLYKWLKNNTIGRWRCFMCNQDAGHLTCYEMTFIFEFPTDAAYFMHRWSE